MATPLSSRRYASPLTETGRPRYYLDTDSGRFYTVPSRRFPRSRRLDVNQLMTRHQTQKDFRVRKNGDVYFRGVKIDYNVHRTIPQKLRATTPLVPTPTPVREQPYYESILRTNPNYQLLSLRSNRDGTIRAIYFNPRNGRLFQVNTSQ